jgi:hypothetical protein
MAKTIDFKSARSKRAGVQPPANINDMFLDPFRLLSQPPQYVQAPEHRSRTTSYTEGGIEIPNYIIGYRDFNCVLDLKIFQVHAEEAEHAIGIFRTAPNPGADEETEVVFVTGNAV